MRYIYFFGGNGYPNCDYEEYMVFSDTENEEHFNKKSNDLAINNAQRYEYVATAPLDHFETDEDADVYYDRISDYCGWIEISATEFNRRTL